MTEHEDYNGQTSRQLMIRVNMRMDYLADRVDKLEKMLERQYITRIEYEAFRREVTAQIEPLRRFVYGLVGLVGAGVLGLFWSIVQQGGLP